MNTVLILAIEDDDDDFYEIELRLRESGEQLDIQRCTRLNDAMALLEREMRFDLLLLDLNLPGLTGQSSSYAYDVVRDKLPEAKIIVLTGNQDVRLADRIRHSGGEFLLKDEALNGDSRLLIVRLMAYLNEARLKPLMQGIEQLRAALQQNAKERESLRKDFEFVDDKVDFLNQRTLRVETTAANIQQTAKNFHQRAANAEALANRAIEQLLKHKAQSPNWKVSFFLGVGLALLLWLGVAGSAYLVIKVL